MSTAQQTWGQSAMSKSGPNCNAMWGKLLWIVIGIILLRGLPAARQGMLIMNTMLFLPPCSQAGDVDVDNVLGLVMDKTTLVLPLASY